MARRPVLAAAVAGGVALLAGAVLLTGTGSHRDTASRTASTSAAAQSSTSVETVSYPKFDDLTGPGVELAGPEKPDGSGAGALVVLAPHYFSFGPYGNRYPGAVKTKNLALSMDQAGVLTLVGDRGPMWDTDTRAPGGHAVFQTDGNLVVYDRDDQPVWASGTDGNPAATLVLQADKNLVIYASDGRPLWATGTDNWQPPSLPGF
ncbi:hypothetical protein [Actinoallomurus rhizosphaericola]|uniref:hypothetical protein n=1 Tax=Actinoallomurus rhizosphaericola TaxID=2952536 RepID=UPI0020928A1A|nr:hypothetical protein [Actinoallomurus rhizosphaericola]MCO5996573.1 hypothetical protein [Actinoallomurus rhizosphaericola]